jgi:hypothetical protein
MNNVHYAGRILVVSLIAPLVVVAVTLAVTFSLAATLPDSVAVHWNGPGIPDGFGSPYTFPILIAVIVLPIVALFGGIAVITAHRSPLTAMTKLIAVLGLWLSVLFALTFVGTMALQRGAISQAHVSIVWLPIGAAAAFIVGAVAWFLLPRAAKARHDDVVPVEPVALGAEERASWIRSTAAPAGLIWGALGLMAIITVVVAVAVLQTADGAWPVSFIPLVLLAVVLTNFAWTVRVDARGVRLRSLLGIPTISVRLGNIRSANVTDVQAMAEFGGVGIRFGMNGRLGIILRSGEALEIQRVKGRTIVVTVDDATTAAALINGLVKRDATPSPAR